MKHLKENNKTYFRHMILSIEYGLKCMIFSFVFFIHAIFPFLFTHTGSNGLENLLKKIKGK